MAAPKGMTSAAARRPRRQSRRSKLTRETYSMAMEVPPERPPRRRSRPRCRGSPGRRSPPRGAGWPAGLLTAQACRGRGRYSGYASPAWRQGTRLADPVSQTLRPRTLSLRPCSSESAPPCLWPGDPYLEPCAPVSPSRSPRISGLKTRISDFETPRSRLESRISDLDLPAHGWERCGGELGRLAVLPGLQ